MKVNYKYASSSMCNSNGNETILGLSPDLSRDEKVSFLGELKHPLIFRDAMLMLREIVISDNREKKKDRNDFFQWLDGEIERRILSHERYLPDVRENIKANMEDLRKEIINKNKEINELIQLRNNVKKEIDNSSVWKDYYRLEHKFWDFIKSRDIDLWFVLDPVITVHPDVVSFEAFSVDESIYGCLSIDMEEFQLLQEPKYGTTNIDFSAKLAREIERFRTYNDVQLSINPEGFGVEAGIMPEHIEKKIDLPDSWIKGFNQVASAATLNGIDVELTPIDMYDICSFLRRNKAHKSPRYMKWILEPGKNIKILFEPFSKVLTLNTIYNGEKSREEKIWGRRRWLILEKLIPISKSFKVRLLGFGMPQFVIADMGTFNMTVGFTSWSSNDWVKGTAFNILSGFIDEGNYSKVYGLLQEKRFASVDEINEILHEDSKTDNKAGVGMIFRKGEGYYDIDKNKVRFRKLINEPIPEELFKTTEVELTVKKYIDEVLDTFKMRITENNEYVFSYSVKIPNSKYKNWRYYDTEDYNREYDYSDTTLTIDEDGTISKLKCNCKEFKRGNNNISETCPHILALYITSRKFLRLKLETNVDYRINDIMEKLL